MKQINMKYTCIQSYIIYHLHISTQYYYNANCKINDLHIEVVWWWCGGGVKPLQTLCLLDWVQQGTRDQRLWERCSNNSRL